MSKRFLMIGAHPDDADIRFGGTAALLTAAGHQVKFVSMCNGNCGHFAMSGDELAERRYAETQASKAISGITEYQVVMENNDCELVADIENRIFINIQNTVMSCDLQNSQNVKFLYDKSKK